MHFFDRLHRALIAARAAWEEPAQEAPPATPAPAGVPAAFRSEPTQHASLLHFYEAVDFSNDPASPYTWLIEHARATLLGLITFEQAQYALPEHVRLHYDWVLKHSKDGCYTHRRKRLPYNRYVLSYDAAWLGHEGVLVVQTPESLLGIEMGVHHRRRTYVTRSCLPHPLFKHLHTIHLPVSLASKLDQGVAAE